MSSDYALEIFSIFIFPKYLSNSEKSIYKLDEENAL